MTEFYDLDHDVSLLDRARGEALRANNRLGIYQDERGSAAGETGRRGDERGSAAGLVGAAAAATDHGDPSEALSGLSLSANRLSHIMQQVSDHLQEMMLLATGEEGGDRRMTPTCGKFMSELQKFYPDADEIADGLQCPICMAAYEEKDHIFELPCTHTFHPECATPWLAKHNTCPVCRHALPTSDSKTRDNATTRSTEAREADIAGLHDSMFG